MTHILITGSAQGLGRAAATTLLDDGHQVVVHARDTSRAAALTDLVDGEPGVECQLDFAQPRLSAAISGPGESLTDLVDAQARVEIWCREMAGMRVHGTTARRPAENVRRSEGRLSVPLPEPYDEPVFTRVKVHRDYHVEVPGRCIRCRSICSARAWSPGRQPARVLSSFRAVLTSQGGR